MFCSQLQSLARVDPPTPPPPPTLSQSCDRQPSVHLSHSSLAGCTTSLQRRIVLLWRANCLPPPLSFYRRGRVSLLDLGASCSDPASGVTAPTVWEASHVTHQCVAEPRVLSHTATLSGNVLHSFVPLYSTPCFSEDHRNKENSCFGSNGSSRVVWNKTTVFMGDVCAVVWATLALVDFIGVLNGASSKLRLPFFKQFHIFPRGLFHNFYLTLGHHRVSRGDFF